MTSRKKCTLYYSLIGQEVDPNNFGTFANSVAAAEVVLEMYCISHEDADEDITCPEVTINGKTILKIPQNIPMEMFFTSKTYCCFITQHGKVLHIGDKNCFSIALFRNDDNREELKIKFIEPELDHLPVWQHRKASIQ